MACFNFVGIEVCVGCDFWVVWEDCTTRGVSILEGVKTDVNKGLEPDFTGCAETGVAAIKLDFLFPIFPRYIQMFYRLYAHI